MLGGVVTDYDCWRKCRGPSGQAGHKPDSAELLKEIIANLQAASDMDCADPPGLRAIAADRRFSRFPCRESA